MNLLVDGTKNIFMVSEAETMLSVPEKLVIATKTIVLATKTYVFVALSSRRDTVGGRVVAQAVNLKPGSAGAPRL
jgi:hypothetical protein